MARRIALLTPDVINQIAAGEVLENPASAVKELIENSIDAGARRIAVEIKGGGHQLIRVEDDGTGMSRADALQCLERHATSKIRETADLLKLSTMGFRGEALAAIASVSELEIQTFDEEESTLLKAEGGRIARIGPCARNRGTTIDVRSLFFNVPARQKFQKSPSSSAAQVLKVVQTIALAHPEIAFSLRSQDKAAFQAEEVSDWRQRVRAILGSLSHEADVQLKGYSLRGLVGSPQEAKGNRSCQYVFVNRRPLFSPLISRAVKDGYGTRLAETDFPSYLLFLDLPPEEFDINVHPQKREIRFRDESKIYRLASRAAALEPAAPIDFPAPIQFTPPFVMKRELLPWVSHEREVQPPLPISAQIRRPVLVIGSFLLLEGAGFFLLDLKGAEARILFEGIEKRGGASQTWIWPIEVELAPDEALLGEEWAKELAAFGIEARYLGGRMLAIDAAPFGIEALDVPEFLERIKEARAPSDRKAASAICRFCRGRSKMFTLEEASLIERRLTECKEQFYDPLGRRICCEVLEENLSHILNSEKLR